MNAGAGTACKRSEARSGQKKMSLARYFLKHFNPTADATLAVLKTGDSNTTHRVQIPINYRSLDYKV